MKKMFTIALLALTVGAFAQTADKTNTNDGEKQSTELKDCKKGDNKGAKKAVMREGKKGGREKFADLNLTEAQKTQLKALKGDRKDKARLAENGKPSKEDIQKRKAAREVKLKQILTEEQYAKFSAKKEMKHKKERRS